MAKGEAAMKTILEEVPDKADKVYKYIKHHGQTPKNFNYVIDFTLLFPINEKSAILASTKE